MEYLTISNTVEYLEGSCFNSCYLLKNVVIPSSVKSIDEYAFQSCYSLNNVVIPSSVTYIGQGAFNNCSSLTGIILPSSIKYLNNYVFSYCTSLTSVVLNYGLKEIRFRAFEGCSSLTSVVIPSSVYLIATSSFNNCSSLTGVVFEQTDGWYNRNGENVYKEVVQSSELVCQQMKNENSENEYEWSYNSWTCRLVAQGIYSIGSASLSIGETETITNHIEPNTATSTVTYCSLDESVATVNENGVITAVGNGLTSIIVEADGCTTPVDVVVGNNKIYALNGSVCSASSDYSPSSYEIAYNGITWANPGGFYRVTWHGYEAIRFDGWQQIESLDEINGVSKIMVTWYMESTSDEYFASTPVELYEGKSRNSLEYVSNNQGTIIGRMIGAENGENLFKCSITFDIHEGSNFFSFYSNNYYNIQEIAFL